MSSLHPSDLTLAKYLFIHFQYGDNIIYFTRWLFILHGLVHMNHLVSTKFPYMKATVYCYCYYYHYQVFSQKEQISTDETLAIIDLNFHS